MVVFYVIRRYHLCRRLCELHNAPKGGGNACRAIAMGPVRGRNAHGEP